MGDYFYSTQKNVLFCANINLQCLQWDFNYDKENYDKRLQLKQFPHHIPFSTIVYAKWKSSQINSWYPFFIQSFL